MLKDYFNMVRNKKVYANKKDMKKKALDLIKCDIELNCKSPNYYAEAFKNLSQQEAYIRKFASQRVGPRGGSDKRLNKVLNIGPKLVSPEKAIHEIPIRLRRESIGSVMT